MVYVYDWWPWLFGAQELMQWIAILLLLAVVFGELRPAQKKNSEKSERE